jgi:hypothetical protein
VVVSVFGAAVLGAALLGAAADWLGVAVGATSGEGVEVAVAATAADWWTGAFANAPLAEIIAAARPTGTASNTSVLGVLNMDTSLRYGPFSRTWRPSLGGLDEPSLKRLLDIF